MFRKEKYIAVFLTKKHNGYSVAKKRRFSADAETVQFKKKKSYVVDASQYTYSKGLKLYYFIDTTNEGQLFFDSSKAKGGKEKAKIIDMFIKQSIVKQITSGLGGGFSGSIMNMIMFFGLGLAIGFIIAGFVM